MKYVFLKSIVFTRLAFISSNGFLSEAPLYTSKRPSAF